MYTLPINAKLIKALKCLVLDSETKLMYFSIMILFGYRLIRSFSLVVTKTDTGS